MDQNPIKPSGSSNLTNVLNTSVLFFDGVCNLCNWAVDFVINHEKTPIIKFASLQSEFAKDLLLKHEKDLSVLNTLYFLDSNNKLFYKSAAVFEVARSLHYPWRIVRVLRFFPISFLDYCYDIIAQNRFKLFGKKETCRIPTESEKNRFLG